MRRHKNTREMVAEGQQHTKTLDISGKVTNIPNNNILELRQIRGQLKQIRNTILSSLGQIDSLLKDIG